MLSDSICRVVLLHVFIGIMIEFVAFERIIFSFFILDAVVLLFKINNSFAISLDLFVFVLDLLMQVRSLLLQSLDPLLLLFNKLTSLFNLAL